MQPINVGDWLAMNRVWGITDTTQTHGGVIPENVMKAANGDILIAVNGDYYYGDKRGVSVNADFSSGKRTGGVLTSREAYGPGSFEVEMKIPSVNGVCTSMWLYETSDEARYNNEIDIEIYGTVAASNSEYGVGSYTKALFSSYQTLTNAEHEYKKVPKALNDGKFHKYRFDWHTGDNARVEFYVDDVLVTTLRGYVPTGEMYLNIGCWLPNGWCGEPDFETDNLVIRGFKYSRFAGETATEVAHKMTESESYRAIPTTGHGFESKLIANGTLAAERAGDEFVWNVSGVTSGAATGGSTFTGEISQDAFIDCGGLDLALTLIGTGAATVTVEYGTIVDGAVVTGSDTFEYAGGTRSFEFTPPAGCTKLTVTIASADGVALDEISLDIV